MQNTKPRRAALSTALFRRLFTAQLISSIGSWTQLNIIGIVVLSRGGSAWFVGALAAARLLPGLILTPWAGLPSRRFGAARSAASAQLVGALCAIGYIIAPSPIAMLVITLVAGIASSIEVPAVTSLTPSVLPADLVQTGSALMCLTQGIARFLGAALGGVVALTFSSSWCFAVNAASFVIASALLSSLPIAHDEPAALVTRLEGARIVWRDRVLRRTGVCLVMFNFAGAAPVVIFPVIAISAASSALVIGALGSLAAFGDIIGSWLAAGSKENPWHNQWSCFALAALSVAMLPVGWLCYPAALLLGVSLGLFYASASATFQLRASGPSRYSVFAAQAALAGGPGAFVDPLTGVIVSTAGLYACALISASLLAGVSWFARAPLHD